MESISNSCPFPEKPAVAIEALSSTRLKFEWRPTAPPPLLLLPGIATPL